MKYLADLHVHSFYSRATSASSTLPGLAAWAAVKGITLLGTGDFTHPGWFAHLQETLEEAEPGLFRLRPAALQACNTLLPEPLQSESLRPETIRFLLSAEISSIYKRDGRVRKIHNLLYAPDLRAVRRINTRLGNLGNIHSDGRPILGLDARDLLALLLDEVSEGFLVPAHIWTPWFSLFGSQSGFDSIEECFGELSSQIFALETGLSSDPAMNRLISSLDQCTLISNSDCHSPGKLGREANLLATELDYFALREALRSPRNAQGQQVFAATIEFYPEEGKYHCDGHRKCKVCLSPAETLQAGGLCPHCGKPVTVGVLNRVMELADRKEPVYPPGSPAVHSLIPLVEIVAELLDCGPASKKVLAGYSQLVQTFGPEFHILLETPVEDFRTAGFSLLAEAISRVRENRVVRQAGYDGEFGRITVFNPGERAALLGQGLLFGLPSVRSARSANPGSERKVAKATKMLEPSEGVQAPRSNQFALGVRGQQFNAEQQGAVDSQARWVLVQAGPGTGKTQTLVAKVRATVLVSERPCVVITFTNKAAAELQERLLDLPTNQRKRVQLTTFHGYCLGHLRRLHPELRVVGPEEREELIAELYSRNTSQGTRSQRKALSRQLAGENITDQTFAAELRAYRQLLASRELIDLDEIVPRTVTLLAAGDATAATIRAATGHIFIDEFQDINQAQYALIAQLATSTTVFAIGDPDQAIYGFRGASPQWFAQFTNEYAPECHRLHRNYRSGASIVQAAGHLIAHNPHPGNLEQLHPCRSLSGRLHLHGCASPEEEAVFLVDQIEVQLGGVSHRSLERIVEHLDADGGDQASPGGISFRDIAVLYRTAAQAQAIAAALTARGLPFQMVNLEAYYTRGDSRLLYEWLLVLGGLAGLEQYRFLLAQDASLDAETLRHVEAALIELLSKTASGLAPVPVCFAQLAVQEGVATSMQDFATLYLHLWQCSREESIEPVLRALIDAYNLDPQEPDLRLLLETALSYGDSLVEFARHLQAHSRAVFYDERAEVITLSTLHAAKGLEFPVVFIAGLEEGLLPLSWGAVSPTETLAQADTQITAQIEEERRLLYVGITRARDELFLTWCRHRAVWGRGRQERRPSRFLKELPAACFLPLPDLPRRKRRPVHRQLSLFS